MSTPPSSSQSSVSASLANTLTNPEQLSESLNQLFISASALAHSSLDHGSALLSSTFDIVQKQTPIILEQMEKRIKTLIPKTDEEMKQRSLQIAGVTGLFFAFRMAMKATASKSYRFTDKGPVWVAGSDNIKKKTVRIYFLRHGESKNNARDTHVSRLPDPPLTSLGEQQSIAAGHYLSKLASYYGIRNIYISPMLKTLQTAIPLVKSLMPQPHHVNNHLSAATSPGHHHGGPGPVTVVLNAPTPSSTGGGDDPSIITQQECSNINMNGTGSGAYFAESESGSTLNYNGFVNGPNGTGTSNNHNTITSNSNPNTTTTDGNSPNNIQQSKLTIPCTIQKSLYEYGGIFEGDRKMSDSELAKYQPNFGLTAAQIRKNMPGVTVGDGITDYGWWRGGKETDHEYLTRVKSVAAWLWRLESNSLIISHGKFLDTLFKILMEIPDPLDSSSTSSSRSSGCSRSNTIFLHGGCALSAIELDRETQKLGVLYLNQPILADSKLRTGHKIGGFSLRQW